MSRRVILQFGCLALLPASARAGSIDQDYSDLMGCRPLSDPFARLKCFDAAASQFHDDVANDQTQHEAKALSWSGNGGRNLPPFNIYHPWMLTWKSDQAINIAVMKSGDSSSGPNIADTVSSDAIENGRSYEEVTGSFYLEIDSDGNWTVSLTRL